MPIPRTPAFRASKLTPSMFLIVEHSDTYGEHPHIYAKVLNDSTILIVDTGCGGKTDQPEITLTSIRKFMETVKVADNGEKPLNPAGQRAYIVVLSHCHYDHILGVEQFATDSQILVSGYAPDFTSPSVLPEHSLCKGLGIELPRYTPTYVPHRYAIQSALGFVHVLHTPGHTPDELALWDDGEKVLYVGDTLYEWAPIIFPSEGSIVDWLESVDALLELVAPFDDARICCGHATADEPATRVLLGAKSFMEGVLRQVIKPVRKFEKRGEENALYVQGDQRFSLICPTRLVVEALANSH